MLSIFEVVDKKKVCFSKKQFEKKNVAFSSKQQTEKKAIHINNLKEKCYSYK